MLDGQDPLLQEFWSKQGPFGNGFHMSRFQMSKVSMYGFVLYSMNILRWNWERGGRGWPVTLGLWWDMRMGLGRLVGVMWGVRIAEKRWALKTNCYLIYLTELGLLQLPLPPEESFSQHRSNGGAHGYPLFRTVRKMMVMMIDLKLANIVILHLEVKQPLISLFYRKVRKSFPSIFLTCWISAIKMGDFLHFPNGFVWQVWCFFMARHRVNM